MNYIVSSIRSFLHDEAGVTAVEYGLIAALIAVAVVATVFLVGSSLNDAFQRLSNCITTPATCNG